MTLELKMAVAGAVFLGFSAAVPTFAMAQQTGPGTAPAAGGVGVGPGAGRAAPPLRRGSPLEYKVYIDAMAIIDDWRASTRNSRIGTPRRSGVTINGTRVGEPGGGRDVLFACTGAAFLDLTFGLEQPDGSVLYDDGPAQGCDPRQALVLNGGRLACNWYTPPPAAVSSMPAERAEIVLGSVPPVRIMGECITETARVVPAIALPNGPGARGDIFRAGPQTVGRPGCSGSGVTVNGRVTGQIADCVR